MATVRHSKVSGQANPGDGRVGGQDWDADHTVTLVDADIPAAIARDAEVTSAVSTHAGAADPHGDRAVATAALAFHDTDTTSVHGITDTSTLYRSGGTDVAVADGGTGSSTAAGARTNLGLVIGTDVLADHGVITYLDATGAAAPGTPASGKARIYAKTDGRIYSKNDAGTEFGPFDVAGASSGYIATITGETSITAYWPFNEGTGTTYVDVIAAANMTALATTPGFCATLTKDRLGGSLHIPSASFRVGRAALTWGATFTIEGWVVAPTQASPSFVFGQWNGAGAMLYAPGASVQAYSGGSSISFVPTTVEMTGRHHVAMTHDGTNVRLYWDGVLKAGPTALALPTTNVGGSWRVGSYSDTTNNGSSIYSDIAFYSGRVLTAGELLAHYNLGA